jgi:hypothetical protein
MEPPPGAVISDGIVTRPDNLQWLIKGYKAATKNMML